MNFGGIVAVVIIVALGIYSIIHSQQRFSKKQKEMQKGDVLFTQMLTEKDRSAIIPMLTRHMDMSVAETLEKYASLLTTTSDALFAEKLRPMRHALRDLTMGKRDLKNLRRREVICLRRAEPLVAGVRLSTSFHLVHNSLRQLLYGLIRIAEPARDHVDNNFTPIEGIYAERYCKVRNRLTTLMDEMVENLRNGRTAENDALLTRCREVKDEMQHFGEELGVAMQQSGSNLNSLTLMLHMAQETRQLVVELEDLIKSLKAYREML